MKQLPTSYFKADEWNSYLLHTLKQEKWHSYLLHTLKQTNGTATYFILLSRQREKTWLGICSIALLLCALSLKINLLKGSASRDFWPPVFSMIRTHLAPDKQAEVFSNSVSISPISVITQFEKIDSAVCITQRSQNFSLSNSKKFS